MYDVMVVLDNNSNWIIYEYTKKAPPKKTPAENLTFAIIAILLIIKIIK